MSNNINGRLEKEIKSFQAIEKKLPKLPAILTDYYYALRAQKKSYKTIQNYINYVDALYKFVSKKYPNDFYKHVTSVDINHFLISLETKTVKGKTVSTSSSFRAINWYALSSFFEFLIDENRIDTNPISKKTRPKITDDPQITYLNEDEIKGIINNIEMTAKNSLKNRDLCLFELGVSTGLRISAIMQINIEDIDFENNVIHVIEKRNKRCSILIGDNLKKQIITWISDRNKYFDVKNTNALFISQYNARMSYDAARKLIIKYSEGVTDKKVRPHVMRHSCATNLYAKTKDIYLCASQLNHSNVKTTQRYAEISNESKRNAANILDSLI